MIEGEMDGSWFLAGGVAGNAQRWRGRDLFDQLNLQMHRAGLGDGVFWRLYWTSND